MKSKDRPNDISTKRIRENILNRDVFGRTVLHITVLCDLPDLMSQVLRIPEAKQILLATDCENGWNVLHYIFYHKRFRCFVVLLEYLEKASVGNVSTLHELLKKKDRSGTPPVFLLRNDVKDFVWIPTYVNENNDFHLEFRYPGQEIENASTQMMRRSWQLDHIMWDRQRGASDLYVMGSNANHSLGVGDSTDRTVPVKLAHHAFQAEHNDLQLFLRKPRFSELRTSKYHSVALTTDGRLFTCGLASKGRLGNGTSRNLFSFTAVNKFEKENISVTQIAVSTGHNLALTTSNELYAWGLNEYNQLGFASTENVSYKNNVAREFENVPTLIATGVFRKNPGRICGIAASKVHSVAYTTDTIYMWGFNVGQMGIDQGSCHLSLNVNGSIFKGSVVEHPKAVTFKDEIKFITASETCTCVVTGTNDIFVFYQNHRCKLSKLPTRSGSDSFDSYKPSRLTVAPVIRKVAMKSPENIFVLLESGDVMAFSLPGNFDMKSARNVKYSYLWRAYDSNLRAVDIDNSYDGSIVLCTRDGSAFMKSTLAGQTQRRSSITSKTPSLAMTSKNKFKKLEGINRVVQVACDELFISFGFMRDETDMLPLKLQKNDFTKDMAYLSLLSEADSYRKQDQLLDKDHDVNCYVSDFLTPARPRQKRADHLLFLQGDREYDDDDDISRMKFSDRLYQRLIQHHTYLRKKKLLFNELHQTFDDDEDLRLRGVLESESSLDTLLKLGNSITKFHDAFIEFRSEANITFGFHTSILACRLKFFDRILNQENEGEYFISEGIKGNYDPSKGSLTFETDVDTRAVLIFLHFVYTNRVLAFWEAYPSGPKCPLLVKKTKDDFTRLMAVFQMDAFHTKEEQFTSQFEGCIERNSGDLLICLRDGDVRCDPSILAARSAFFETFLSERWDVSDDELEQSPEEEVRHINLEGIDKAQFEIVLRHIHGCNDLNVFDNAYLSVAKNNESDDFINLMLDMIQIADELLLIQLKHLCELAIKDLINIDNALILAAHAYYLSASKLFKCCCWCIFNNLDTLVFLPSFKDLDCEILVEVEKEMRFLQLMKQTDFVIGDKGEVNINLLKSSNGPSIDMNAISEFGVGLNDIFLTDDLAFKPIFDQSPEQLGGVEEKKRRSSSRRLSRRESGAELHREMQSLNLNKVTRKASDSAIADDIPVEESDFEVVSSRRRRKSKPAPIPPPAPTSQSETSDSEISRNQIFDSSRSESASPPPSSAPKPAALNWGSRNSSTSSIAKSPLGPALGDLSLQTGKSKSKIKFAANKPSQNQRKKLGVEAPIEKKPDVEPSSAPVLKNPWKPVASSLASHDNNLGNMPVLGSSEEVPQNSPGSLTAIMLEESLKIENQKYMESQRKSLQEIQQEQEFAKWWEEESRRVQQEMKGPTSKSRNDNQKNGKARKPRKPKKKPPSQTTN